MKTAFLNFMDCVPDGTLGVAVSGGGDSIALLVLMADWAQEAGRSLRVVTVDHGLRSGSAAEAGGVAVLCTDLGLPHDTLLWQDHPETGNLQDNARQARQNLISDWAVAHGIAAVTTGHTRDDQAETFLLRLKRGSGVDGLSGMAAQVTKDGLIWLRPLLDIKRQTLRDFLRQRQISWVEDPSNDDLRFDRVKMRKALNILGEIGLNADVLADTAARMQTARGALESYSKEVLGKVAQPRDIGSVRLDTEALTQHPMDIQLRVLAHCLRWVSGVPYRPRLKALHQALAHSFSGTGHSLSGCLLTPIRDEGIEITREVSAMVPSDASTCIFDGRWHCEPAQGQWRPLGSDGILQRPEWRDTAETRNAILASPSLWYNNELKSVPFVDKNPACGCWLRDGTESFYATIVTH